MRTNGFTLIEILVAATIIAVLTAIGVVSYTSINQRSRDAKRKSDLEQIRSALEMYRADNGHYPYRCGWVSYNYPSPGLRLKELLVPDYMTAVPLDPKISNPAGYAVSGGDGSFGYMYSSDNCSAVLGRHYALWAQLESPSAADTASLTQGSETQYNTGYGMNYKVSNPP